MPEAIRHVGLRFPNPVDPMLLLTAMREQLGLTVKSQKVPVDILVIDGAEKVAAGN